MGRGKPLRRSYYKVNRPPLLGTPCSIGGQFQSPFTKHGFWIRHFGYILITTRTQSRVQLQLRSHFSADKWCDGNLSNPPVGEFHIPPVPIPEVGEANLSRGSAQMAVVGLPPYNHCKVVQTARNSTNSYRDCCMVRTVGKQSPCINNGSLLFFLIKEIQCLKNLWKCV